MASKTLKRPIFLRHKLHGSFPSVTCSEMNTCRNFFVCRKICEKKRPVLLLATVTKKTFFSGHVTLGNDSGNLCRNGATKLRDKLEKKLPSVTAPLRNIKEI